MPLLKVVLFSSSVFLFLACSVKEPVLKEVNKRVNELEVLVLNLNPKVSHLEARDLAESSINYSLELARKYKVISSPWIQNTLVNLGFRKRGLCYEWSEDLLWYLYTKHYKTLELHAIGANIGYLNEHNALSVSVKGEGIENSIVLDAWRNSGNLYFKKIAEDVEYEWEERVGLYENLPL